MTIFSISETLENGTKIRHYEEPENFDWKSQYVGVKIFVRTFLWGELWETLCWISDFRWRTTAALWSWQTLRSTWAVPPVNLQTRGDWRTWATRQLTTTSALGTCNNVTHAASNDRFLPRTRGLLEFDNYGSKEVATCGSVSWQIKGKDGSPFSVRTESGQQVR